GLVEIFPGLLVRIISNDPELISQGTTAFRFMLLTSPKICFQIVCGGLYQALGRARISFINSLMRQIICLVPLLLILPQFFGLD
ncbi:MATE family efflux transporter, partial [Listeria monocytogenes]|nr:MATE family efflux transporter [Listeria monocytogenes]